MNRTTFVKLFESAKLRTVDVAALGDTVPQRVTDFLRLRKLNAGIEQRIAEAIVVLHGIQKTVAPAAFDVSTPEKIIAAQRWIALFMRATVIETWAAREQIAQYLGASAIVE